MTPLLYTSNRAGAELTERFSIPTTNWRKADANLSADTLLTSSFTCTVFGHSYLLNPGAMTLAIKGLNEANEICGKLWMDLKTNKFAWIKPILTIQACIPYCLVLHNVGYDLRVSDSFLRGNGQNKR